MHYDAIIIGAGAAGLMCAMSAGQRGRRVLVIEASHAVGEKIRISGGGRCNFTNIHTTPANYLSQNPRFCISALRRYTPQDFIALLDRHQIAYHEKTLGQLFCDGSATQIIAMLVGECKAAGVDIWLNTRVSQIAKPDTGFTLTLSDGQELQTPSLVIATGGPSIPKMGATGWGYEVAKQFDIPVVPPRPALVPLTIAPPLRDKIISLAGVSQYAAAAYGKTQFKEGILFTHYGLSGPAILQISSYWREGEAITLNLLPDQDAFAWLKTARQQTPKQEIPTLLAQALPKRLAQFLCEEHGWSGRIADCSNTVLQTIAKQLNAWALHPNGTQGYAKAEVTLGGVDTGALSSTSMEAKQVAGLYFIGEVVDVTGHLGGFNFQWAWASGYAAGQCV